MTQTLSIRLLGAPGIYAGGHPVDVTASRTLPIVALLAAAQARVPRERMAALLWRRVEASSALASLRQVIHHFPEPLRSVIAADRTALALEAAAVDCDLWLLLQALAGDAPTAALLELYRGPLLGDAAFDDLPEFDDWLRAERARIAGLVRDRALAEAARARESGNAGGAMELARAWLQREPADETMHAELLRAHIANGDVSAAQAQFDLLRRTLATSAGRAPAPATRAILDAALRATPSLRGANIPALATSFVGRQDELAELARLASDPHCRLITLHGPGGVGKTRIALAFADETLRHGEAAWFVGLEAAQTAQGLYAAIAAAFGLELAPKANPRDVLCKALSATSGLLVLDNFEQLLPSDPSGSQEAKLFVPELLRAAPRLEVLVTSRTTLGVQEEWLLAVGGLAYPASDESAAGAAAETAIELFTSRARQAYRGFSRGAELPHILAICRAADGLPLALELAAAQVGHRPCADIARNLLADDATQRPGNRPERQASVRRVLEQSLAAAPEEVVRAFISLALFQGAFGTSLAFAVARAGEGTLQELCGRALLQRVGDGFKMHPLLRELAAARLARARALAARVEAAYVVEIARRAQVELAKLLGYEIREAMASVPARLADELNALRRACAIGDGASAVALAGTLAPTALARGLVRICMEAWPRLEGLALDAADLAALLVYRAFLRRNLGEFDEALADCDEAERMLVDAPAERRGDLRVRIHIGRAGVRLFRGEYREVLESAVRLREAGDEGSTLADRLQLAQSEGTALMELGDTTAALERLEPMRQEAEAAGASSLLMVYLLNALASTAEYKGEFEKCGALHQQAIRALDRDGLRRMKTPHLCNLGSLRLAVDDVAGAEPVFAEAIEIATDFGDVGPLTYSLVGFANTALARGDLEQADARAGDALAQARRIDSWALICEAQGVQVRVALRSNRALRAKELLGAMRAALGDKLEGFRKVEIAYLDLATARALGEAREGEHAAAMALQADPACSQALRLEILAWAAPAARVAAE